MTDSAQPPCTIVTERYIEALAWVRPLVADEARKGGDIPYLSHLLEVSATVLAHGGSEDAAIAALLHDAAEDSGGEALLHDIGTRFGVRVAAIVRACSDSLVADRTAKAPWWKRKAEYIEHLAGTDDPGVAVVAAADKLSNLRTCRADYATVGEALFPRFHADAGRAGTLWYYRRVSEVLSRWGVETRGLTERLTAEVQGWWGEVAAANPSIDLEAEYVASQARALAARAS